jgi:hypothetical protein
MEPAVTGRRRAVAIAVAVLMGALFAAGPVEARTQDAPQAAIKPAAAAPGQARPAAARPVRERMAVNVLLGWVWLSIAVLLGFLRSRVREADRVHRLGLNATGSGSPKERGR